MSNGGRNLKAENLLKPESQLDPDAKTLVLRVLYMGQPFFDAMFPKTKGILTVADAIEHIKDETPQGVQLMRDIEAFTMAELARRRQ